MDDVATSGAPGTCSTRSQWGIPERGDADCDWYSHGKFVLTQQQRESLVPSCRALCTACQNCNFVSVGRGGCSWHRACEKLSASPQHRTFRRCNQAQAGLPVYVLAPAHKAGLVQTIASWLRAGDAHDKLRLCVEHAMAPDGRALDLQRMLDEGRLSPGYSGYFVGRLNGSLGQLTERRRSYLHKEIGISEGHMRLWQRFAAVSSSRPQRVALVFEDDVVLSDPAPFVARLQQVLQEIRISNSSDRRAGKFTRRRGRPEGPSGLYFLGYGFDKRYGCAKFCSPAGGADLQGQAPRLRARTSGVNGGIFAYLITAGLAQELVHTAVPFTTAIDGELLGKTSWQIAVPPIAYHPGPHPCDHCPSAVATRP